MPALTEAIKTDLYRFFAVAFNAAPGTVYMGQLVDAVVKGDMTTQRVVEEFTTKSQFTDIYPTFMSNTRFAEKLVDNVVGSAASNAAKADAASQIVAALTAGDSRGKVIFTIFSKLAGLAGDATWGGVATQLANQVKAAQYYTEMLAGNSTDPAVLRAVIANASSTADSGADLRVGMDNLSGSVGADNFNAYVVNNANTLESGDMINGGSGFDSLRAVLGSSADFAITPRTTGVEAVFIRAQSIDSVNGSSGENNVNQQTLQKVTIDAQDMVGVTQWHNENSRADLKIEDVRILEGQITKDITIRLADTDPGSMGGAAVGNGVSDLGRTDFEVYFSPESLRAAGSTQANSTVTFRFSDNRGTATKPAASLNVDVNFTYNGKAYTVKGVNSGTTDTVDAGGFYAPGTYAQFVANLNAKLKAIPDLAGLVAADAGAVASLDVTNADGVAVTQVTPFGRAITITDPAGKLFAAPTFNAATSGATFSIDGNAILGTPTTTNFLITSTIILDNVGRESEAGALVIGSMSTRTGVERFEITVDNNDNTSGSRTTSGSWLGSISSTNNRLQEVVAVNAPVGTSGPDYLHIGTGPALGNNLTGPRAAPGLLNTDGLTDVRLFDASAMSGVVRVGAAITSNSIAKYQNLLDTASNDAADNVSFVYSTGSGNDTINLAISGNVAGFQRSDTTSGRHDFTFAVNGGAGNDTIRVVVGAAGAADTNGNNNWYANQDINNNITIDGGTGNDTVLKPSAGDVNINLGDGDDTTWTDNTGTAAQFVYNNAVGSRATEDLRSDVAGSVSAVNAQLRVNYGGLLSGVVGIGGSVGSSSNVTITDLHVNQAIKDAINNDPVLNKLLIAQDGPGRTLLVVARTDGAEVAAADGTSTAIQIVFSNATATAGATTTQFTAATGFAELAARYVTEVSTTGGVNNLGTNSIATTDNTITGGAGNDVIVLSTNTQNDAFSSSNEVVVLTAGFGTDTIVNYSSAGSGIDYIDASALGGTTYAGSTVAAGQANNSITIANESTAATGNDTAAKVAALYANTTNATASTHVYMAVNATANADGTTTNSAKVYSVTDPAGVAAATATFQGTIVFDGGVVLNNATSTATGLNFATAVPTAFMRTIAAADAGALNIGGTSANDTVVLRGGYSAGVYAGTDAAGRDLTTGLDFNGALAGPGVRTVTGTIDLGAGSDTLVTYGNLDLTGATLTGIENIVANSGLRLSASQLNALPGAIQFTNPRIHKLEIVNDLVGTATLNLAKIVLSGGELLLNTGGANIGTSKLVDNSTTGNAWITTSTLATLSTVETTAAAPLTTANNTTTAPAAASSTAATVVVVGTAPTGTGGGTGGGVPG